LHNFTFAAAAAAAAECFFPKWRRVGVFVKGRSNSQKEKDKHTTDFSCWKFFVRTQQSFFK